MQLGPVQIGMSSVGMRQSLQGLLDVAGLAGCLGQMREEEEASPACFQGLARMDGLKWSLPTAF